MSYASISEQFKRAANQIPLNGAVSRTVTSFDKHNEIYINHIITGIAIDPENSVD